MNIKKMICLSLVALLVWTCNSEDKDQTEESTVSADTLTEQLQISDEVVTDIINSVPSPLEMTAMIKESGSDFSKKILNNTDFVEDYSTGYKKALNLGVYGADLGYINIYGKTHLAFNYLSAVKSLADELKIGQFFDFATLKRLAGNNQNVDSMLYISTSGFEKMNNYLNERKRGDVSILILVGGWIESLNIAIKAMEGASENKSGIIERIGEQKIVLDDISLILSVYQKSPGVSGLIVDLNQLKKIYGDVIITYSYEEPEMKEVDGMLVVVDNSSSTVEVTDEVLDQIATKINSIRNKIVKQ